MQVVVDDNEGYRFRCLGVRFMFGNSFTRGQASNGTRGKTLAKPVTHNWGYDFGSCPGRGAVRFL